VLDRHRLFSNKRALPCLGCAAFFAGAALFVSVSSSGAADATATARAVRRYGGPRDPNAPRAEFRIDGAWRLGVASWREEPVPRKPAPDAAAERARGDAPAEPAVQPPEELEGLEFAVIR
jgi:hypothetical protein